MKKQEFSTEVERLISIEVNKRLKELRVIPENALVERAIEKIVLMDQTEKAGIMLKIMNISGEQYFDTFAQEPAKLDAKTRTWLSVNLLLTNMAR